MIDELDGGLEPPVAEWAREQFDDLLHEMTLIRNKIDDLRLEAGPIERRIELQHRLYRLRGKMVPMRRAVFGEVDRAPTRTAPTGRSRDDSLRSFHDNGNRPF